MSINGVTYVGDDPRYVAELEKKIAEMERNIKTLLSQNNYLKAR